jgi:hypothetical protein
MKIYGLASFGKFGLKEIPGESRKLLELGFNPICCGICAS